MGYETEAWREPTPLENDEVLYTEHGRSVNNTDFRSHWFMFVKQRYGGYAVLVKHGGGQERVMVGYDFQVSGVLAALAAIDSDQRYLLLYTLMQVHSDATRKANQETASRYQLAFLEGRMKRRRRNNQYYVEVQPKIITEQTA